MERSEARRLGEMIRDRRDELDISQGEAATAARRSENYWWRVEKGQALNVSTKTLMAMAGALGWPERTLVDARDALVAGREPEIPVASDERHHPDLASEVKRLDEEIRWVRGDVARLSSQLSSRIDEIFVVLKDLSRRRRR